MTDPARIRPSAAGAGEGAAIELVTVIVGAYNVEQFLPQGMECIRNQSYPHFEVILVDDGSTDATGARCDALAAEDPRIRVVHQPNGGLASARNTGLEHARGTYVAFYDVDDAVDTDWLEHNVEMMRKTGAELVMHGLTVCDHQGALLDTLAFPELHLVENRQIKERFAELFVFVRHGNGFMMNKFYRKSFLDRQGARFGDERIRQDEPFNLRLYPHLSSLAVSGRTPYHYVVYPHGNAGTRYVPEKFAICRSIYRGFRQFCRQWGLEDPALDAYNHGRYLGNLVEIFLLNLVHDDCRLPVAKRWEEARKIMADPDTSACLRSVAAPAEGGEERFYRFCLKHRLALTMLGACWMRKQLKRLLKGGTR
ncbi:hypothetical protein GMSM_20680 [Geomonas sp. Red276]